MAIANHQLMMSCCRFPAALQLHVFASYLLESFICTVMLHSSLWGQALLAALQKKVSCLLAPLDQFHFLIHFLILFLEMEFFERQRR